MHAFLERIGAVNFNAVGAPPNVINRAKKARREDVWRARHFAAYCHVTVSSIDGRYAFRRRVLYMTIAQVASGEVLSEGRKRRAASASRNVRVHLLYKHIYLLYLEISGRLSFACLPGDDCSPAGTRDGGAQRGLGAAVRAEPSSAEAKEEGDEQSEADWLPHLRAGRQPPAVSRADPRLRHGADGLPQPPVAPPGGPAYAQLGMAE